jgi:small Trp-rich protein
MWAVWVGLILVLLKAAGIGPFAQWEWWWIFAPLGAAIVWFEGLEKLFGRDRRKIEHDEMEQRRKERLAETFKAMHAPRKR